MATKDTTHESCSRHLVQLVPALMRIIRRGVLQSDPQMSIAHLRVLDFLSKQPGASLSELSSELAVTNATASSHVDKLVKRGLVKRVEDPAERRRVVLTLTDEGVQRLELVRQISTGTVAEMLAGLPAGKLNRIQDGVALLQECAKQFAENQNKSTEEDA